MRPVERPHWHIDYLRKKTTLEAVWFRYHEKSLEHAWAKRFAAMPGAAMPMAGFGASDCGCEAHLFFFRECPAKGLSLMATRLGSAVKRPSRPAKNHCCNPPESGNVSDKEMRR
jgi:Uri superfamily endonuclease